MLRTNLFFGVVWCPVIIIYYKKYSAEATFIV